ncbi:MAG: hypothetical protein A2V65_11570 [Deltaproteobacteria bacterium RBG_13_49_15]|nr:MAG: hypothetical protein A2V65_11570 [Deltaproteobacteria bacterium RBG_13_49_15]
MMPIYQSLFSFNLLPKNNVLSFSTASREFTIEGEGFYDVDLHEMPNPYQATLPESPIISPPTIEKDYFNCLW